jgi:hypothetical protein
MKRWQGRKMVLAEGEAIARKFVEINLAAIQDQLQLDWPAMTLRAAAIHFLPRPNPQKKWTIHNEIDSSDCHSNDSC